MRKAVAGAVIGIAVFAGGSMVLVDRLLGAGDGGPGPPAAPGWPGAPEPSLPPTPMPAPEVLARLRNSIHPDQGELLARLEREKQVTPAPPPPPKGSWEAVPVSSFRARSAGGLGAAVQAELNELHDAIAACFDEESQARHGQGTVAAVKDALPPDETGVIALVLQLETRNGEVVVVDAPVETRGDASDGTLACAQGLLRGRVLPVPGAKYGERHRYRYQLTP